MHSTTLPFMLQLPPDLPCVLDLHALAAHFKTLVDHRHRRGIRYPLAPLLALAVCAKLAGYSRITALAEWAQLRAPDLARLFGLTRTTMPHPSTWSRLFAEAVNVAALEQLLGTFFQQLHQPLGFTSITDVRRQHRTIQQDRCATLIARPQSFDALDGCLPSDRTASGAPRAHRSSAAASSSPTKPSHPFVGAMVCIPIRRDCGAPDAAPGLADELA